jgi:hypothetical protein
VSGIAGSGNFKLKSYLHLYFNSKYAEGYEAVLGESDSDNTFHSGMKHGMARFLALTGY